MKTVHKVFVAGLCLSLISAQQSFSQNSLPLVASASLVNNAPGAGSATPRVSEESAVNSKAIQHFHQAYPEANEVVWNTNSNGSYAHFVSEGTKVLISYDRRGRWTSTIRTLPNDQIPADIVSLVNNGFPNYKIFLAQDISVGNASAYIMKVESSSKWKTLKVTDDGIDIIEEFDKQ